MSDFKKNTTPATSEPATDPQEPNNRDDLDELLDEAHRDAGGYFIHCAIEDVLWNEGLRGPGEYVDYDEQGDGTLDIVLIKTDGRKIVVGKLKKDK